MEFEYTPRFLRSLKKLPPAAQKDIIEAVKCFADSPHHPQLKLHRLSGRMKGLSAFSANFSFRVVIQTHKGRVYFVDVGNHDIYE